MTPLLWQLKADIALQLAVALAKRCGTEVDSDVIAEHANRIADALVNDQERRGWVREADAHRTGSVTWVPGTPPP